jgi:hypothetical protein
LGQDESLVNHEANFTAPLYALCQLLRI